MSNLLITGITGFVGQNLKPYLSREYTVIGVSRNPNAENVISYQDLNPETFCKTEAFIHLAGKAHDLRNVSNDEEYFQINTELTIKLFDQFLESDCPIFIFMSSVKAVADEVDGLLTEETEARPKTVYGISKRKAEEYILSKDWGAKKVYILRPCMIHGPNNKGNLNLLYQFVSKGIPYPLAAYENQRSFLSVANLSFLVKELLQKKPTSGIYHLADSKSLSSNDLVRIIAEESGKTPRLWRIPKGLIEVMGRLGTMLNLPFNEERIHKLTENYVVENTKILKELDTRLPLDAEEGIRYTIQSFRK